MECRRAIDIQLSLYKQVSSYSVFLTIFLEDFWTSLAANFGPERKLQFRFHSFLVDPKGYFGVEPMFSSLTAYITMRIFNMPF